MEIQGVYIDLTFLVAAFLCGLVVGGGLFWFQRMRVKTPSRSLSFAKIILCVFGTTLSLYYIFSVVIGGYRPGWP